MSISLYTILLISALFVVGSGNPLDLNLPVLEAAPEYDRSTMLMKSRPDGNHCGNEFNWQNSNQRQRCESSLIELQESFLKARHSAALKATCEIAQNAEGFLTIHENSRRYCPAQFLEKNGYTIRVVRKMQWLKTYSLQNCTGVNNQAR
jgi:hypothetical protein